MARLRLIVIILAISLALTAPTTKASLIGFTYEQIQSGADLILLGKVTGSTSHIGTDSSIGVIPYLLRNVTVEHYYKGDGPTSIEVKELGGSLGGGGSVWVEDQPELSIGTTYVLFLREGDDGFNYVFGGPQGALPVVDGVAKNFAYMLRVTDLGLIPFPAENVRVNDFQNRTYPIANDPAALEIHFDEGVAPGYWTFHVAFAGISGEATGILSKQEVSDFIHGGPSFVLFDHNFTAPGDYTVAVDGVSLGTLNVQESRPQVTLSWAVFSSDMFFVGDPITMRVGSIRSNQTGEYRAISVVTPRVGGVEPFYQSYATYSADSNWFTFHFDLKEAGNYTISVWQGGEKQLTREISVNLPPSTSVGPKARADTSAEAARAAEEAARAAQTSEFQNILPQNDLSWIMILLLALFIAVWLFFINTRK
jgi:hypothetical protein